MFNLKKFFNKKSLIDPNVVNHHAELIKSKNGLDLYKTVYNDYFWLNPNKYLDREIINQSVFEPYSTTFIKKLLKKGDVVLDVGANIGYYTVIMSKLVGITGKVYAFEPTKYYGDFLLMNVKENDIENCEVLPIGLSSKACDVEISFGESSATMHWVADFDPRFKERITLTTLDDFIHDKKITRIDFIKIDVDGHEPEFLKGAAEVLAKMQPVILLEVSHEHYLNAGITAWDFYADLIEQGYHVYSERTLKEYRNLREFLLECGNFAYSANIIISKNELDRNLPNKNSE